MARSNLYLDRGALAAVARGVAGEWIPSPRRTLYLGGYSALWASMRTAVRAVQRVDDVAAPGYRSQRVEAPFFVFANMRSGTTLMHNLLFLDRERFSSFELWETMLPSASLRRSVDALRRADLAVGGPFDRAAKALNRRLFSGWDGLHAMGLGRLEEDEALFLYTGLSPGGLFLLFPQATELPRVHELDQLEPDVRRRVMDWYEDVIRRHLHAVGGDRRFLSKNCFTAGRVRSFVERWPDAQMVYLVRHPYEAIPSCVNLFYLVWRAYFPDLERDSDTSRALARWAVRYYRLAMEYRRQAPPERLITLRYDALVADPVEAVERVYAHFGMQPTAEYRARLEQTVRLRDTDRFKSTRQYTLADFGVAEREVYEPLADLFDELGYEP